MLRGKADLDPEIYCQSEPRSLTQPNEKHPRAPLRHPCSLAGCAALRANRFAGADWLDRAGFAPVTRFIRMVHGPTEIFSPDHQVHAIAGPELS